MAANIRLLDRQTEAAWDEFVGKTPQATFFHRAGWKDVIERSFRHKAHYVLAEQDGAITGILPLVHIKSRVFGNRLVSVPFCVYGGPVAVEIESAARLIDYSITLAERSAVNAIEFRGRDVMAPEWATRSDLYATFRKAISDNPEINLKAIPRKQRAVVRKSLEAGLRAAVTRDVRGFYPLYAESVRNLGTPVFSRRYLEILSDVFRHDAEITTVFDQSGPLSAVLSFFFRDEVLPYYGGGNARARRQGAYDFMYWDVMDRAVKRGARVFDFGRSKAGTGAFAFKRNWGFEAQPLHYQYWIRPGDEVPDLNPLNPKYRLMISIWKRLPLPVANRLGPMIARGIG